MALYPGATVTLLSRKYAGYRALSAHNRMNLHVAVSLASTLFGYFNRAYKPSSHFYVLKNGKVLQYVDTSRAAEADLEGNDATHSVETQGGLFNAQTEPWTPEQCETLADLYAWDHKTHGLPLRLATDSKLGASSKGLSWHRLGIDGNFPSTGILRGRLQRGGGMHYSTSRGKVCPGDAKILQIPGILARAKEIVSGVPGVPPVVALDRWLRRGFTGPDVALLQNELNAANLRWKFTTGKALDPDGAYGPLTEGRVTAFQAWVNGLPGLTCKVDGGAGTETFKFLVGAGVAQIDAALTPPEPEPTPEPVPDPEPEPTKPPTPTTNGDYDMQTIDLRNAGAIPVRNADMGKLQALLMAHGYGPAGLVAANGRPDGIGGTRTRALFGAFQAKHPATGTNGRPDLVCADKSWRELIEG